MLFPQNWFVVGFCLLGFCLFDFIGFVVIWFVVAAPGDFSYTRNFFAACLPPSVSKQLLKILVFGFPGHSLVSSGTCV